MNTDGKAKLTRRRFLAVAGGTVGVATLACGGLMALNSQQPPVEFTQSSCGGENEMSDRMLVAYASKCGSTGSVAEAIGQTLCHNGTAVDVRLLKDVNDISPYRAVVVGSAARMGQWLPEAVKFVETHQTILSKMPVAYFTVCMTLMEDSEENRREVTAYSDAARQLVQPVDVGMFAGAMDYGKLSLPFRLIMKGMKVPEGDHRDWDAIRAWAAAVQPRLLEA
jgi:menaquinone-dependent protoporphyrinogen oxidase